MFRLIYRELWLLLAASLVAAPVAHTQDYTTPSVAGTELYFIAPQDGEQLTSPVRVKFGLRGMGVAPAGTEKPGTGHHHLLVDVPLPPLDENIIADENHIHFGGGQTETLIDLPAGTHTLQLLLGDQNHLPHNPPVYSRKITIIVTGK